jgi:hypothetical protein
MPARKTKVKVRTHEALKQSSFESLVISWLMHDGWQVFVPMLDHGHSTDILISDGPNYHRIQIKTVAASDEGHIVENKWKGNDVDVVVYFARNSTWGYVTPGFSERERPINAPGHERFERTKNDFLKAFHKLGTS